MEKDEELKELYDDLLRLTKKLGDLLGENTNNNLNNIETDNDIDIKNVSICLYNQDCIGLFRRINLIPNENQDRYYRSGIIYLGINSTYEAIKITHMGNKFVNYWAKQGTSIRGENDTYVVNCDMIDAISFNDLRFIKYRDHNNNRYDLEKASNEEVFDLLKYASSYFEDKKKNEDKPKKLFKRK